MTERATFKYTGPEQEIRIGSETFRRDREVLVTDAAAIAEARAHPEVAEEGPNGWVAGVGADAPDDPATGGATPKEDPAPVAPKARVRSSKSAKKQVVSQFEIRG